MLQKVTEAAVDGGGFLGAVIFRKEDGSARLQMEAGAGALALIGKMQISTDPAVPHGQGLGGIAFRSNKPCISNNVTSDTRIRPWWDLAKAAGSRSWISITSSSDGTKLAAVVFFGDIYTSTDGGATWTDQTAAGSRRWWPITSSSDGTTLAAVADGGGDIWTASIPPPGRIIRLIGGVTIIGGTRLQ
jgi:hypothetical protein